MDNIAVIGAGTMGNGIAHLLAQHGKNVSLIDVSQEALNKALATIEKNLDRQVKKEILSEDDKVDTLNRISTFSELSQGVKDCSLVIEAATENLSLKLKIFSELDNITEPSVILASNTSSISITQIAAATKRAEKVIGMHFMNPVPVMKLVEIIRGYNTSDEVTKLVFDLSKSLNKVPV